jgi:hypothetical protein
MNVSWLPVRWEPGPGGWRLLAGFSAEEKDLLHALLRRVQDNAQRIASE